MNSAKFYYRQSEAPLPNKPNHFGAAAVIVYENKVLMELRKDCSRWSLIGGALETGESLPDCIRREIREETSLEVDNLVLFGMFSDPSRIIAYPDGNIMRSITAAFIINVADIQPLEVSEESHRLEFVPIARLLEYDIVETHRHIVESFLAWDHKNVIVE